MKFQRKSPLHTTYDTNLSFMIIRLIHSISIKHLLIVKVIHNSQLVLGQVSCAHIIASWQGLGLLVVDKMLITGLAVKSL
jgi:hypothetical protein